MALPKISDILNGVTSIAENNPVTKFLLGGAMNVAQDIGTGLGAITSPGQQQSSDASLNMANQARQKAMTVQDPAEKQRLLTVAQNAVDTNASNAQTMTQGYSPDVAKNPLLRGAQAGIEVGTGADIAAHPIQTIKGTIDLAKGALNAVRHPIQTLDAAGKAIDTLPETINTAIHNPTNFKLDQTPNGLNKLGNRWLLGQYKNADEVSRDPLGVVTTLKGYGLSSPQDIADSAKLITGKADETNSLQAIVHKKVLNAVSQSDPVDVNGIMDQTKNSIDDMTNVTEPQAQRALATVQRKVMNTTGLNIENNDMLNAELAKGAQTGLTDADPSKVLKTTQELDQLSHTAYSAAYDKQGNLVNPAQKELAEFYSQTSGTLKSRLFDGTTSDPSVTRMGANTVRLPNSWTAEEANILNGIGNGKLGKDIMSSTSVPELRKYEALFTSGGRMANNVLDAGEKSPSLTQMATGLATILHPNPIGPGLFAASTTAGKEAIGNTLNTLGDVTAGVPSATLKGSIAAQGLPIIANQNNQNNQGSNPNQSAPPNSSITPSIAPVVKPIAWSDLPTDSTKVTSDTPLTPPTMITDKSGNPLAMVKTDNTDEELNIQNQMKDPSVLYNPVAYNKLNERLKQLQTIDSQSSPIMGKYNDASDTNNAVDTALNLLSSAPTGLFNANGLVSDYNTLYNGKYANLQAQLAILQKFYPTMAKTILQSPNKDVAQGVLNQIKTRVKQDYTQYINTQTGNFPGTTPQATSTPQSTNPFTPTATGLQSIPTAGNASAFKPLPHDPMLDQ